MPRTIESISAAHHAVRARRASGRPVWDVTVRLADVLGKLDSDEMSFEEWRDAIVARIRASRWSALTSDEFGLADLLDNLVTADDLEEFNGWWDELYDLANYDRVWLATV